MKNSIGVFFMLAVALGCLLPGGVFAVENHFLFVESMNGAPSAVTVGLTLNSNPADSLGFSLGGGASRNDMLTVGPNSSNPLHLGAQVSMGSLSTSCSISLSYDNLTGDIGGAVDPTYALKITYTPGSTDTSCKHDNGNHIGEDLHKLGLVVGKDVPFHAGKLDSNGQPMCKDHGKGSTSTSTPATLSCQFAFVSAI